MNRDDLKSLCDIIRKGMALPKCRKCGCMKEALEEYKNLLLQNPLENEDLQEELSKWEKELEPVKYSCLGCPYCYGAEATNIVDQIKPQHSIQQNTCCQSCGESAELVSGEFYVIDAGAKVAVSTLASPELAEDLSIAKPKGLCIVGKTETENIGVEKVIKNTIRNSSIRYLILSGKESSGHLTGQAFMALKENGVDTTSRIIEALGKRPVLKNATNYEIETFRNQVQIIDMIGCEDISAIAGRISALNEKEDEKRACSVEIRRKDTPTPPTIQATEPSKVELDRAGYFLIIPRKKTMDIVVEHYANDNTLLHTLQGVTARSLYSTIIANGWITQLSHSAYLGKELTRAELSLKMGFRFDQDGA